MNAVELRQDGSGQRARIQGLLFAAHAELHRYSPWGSIYNVGDDPPDKTPFPCLYPNALRTGTTCKLAWHFHF
jgi:hypothetical protein